MTSRPSRYLIVGQKVLEEVRDKASEPVRETVAKIVRALETGPYPDDNNLLRIFEPRGISHRNSFIVMHDDVFILYQVMLDQPVIFLIGIDWRDETDV